MLQARERRHLTAPRAPAGSRSYSGGGDSGADAASLSSQSSWEAVHSGRSPVKWWPDEQATNCMHCDIKFSKLLRKHHCRLR